MPCRAARWRSRTTRGLSSPAAGLATLLAVLPRPDPYFVKGWFAHRAKDTADLGKLDDLLPGLRHAMADRACCCPARPVVTVIIPPGPGRPHSVDLLLCGHHFQVSRAALKAAGAAVYDDTGALVAGGASEDELLRGEHGAAARRRGHRRRTTGPPNSDSLAAGGGDATGSQA